LAWPLSFEGAEDRVLQLKLGQIEREYERPVVNDRKQIMSELTAFLRRFREAIGQSRFVDDVVNSQQSLSDRLPEAAAE
jgi:hypothetical protein